MAAFSHQIQSEYYGSNQYMYIGGIILEHFITTTHTETETTPQARTCPAVFHYFFLMTKNKILPQLLQTVNT